MSDLYCLNCGHQFPADGARKKPDRTGKIIFTSIGAIGILFAAFCIVVAMLWFPEQRMNFLGYALLAALAGLGSIGIGLSLGKGLYSYCPACEKGMALPSDSKAAIHEKRKRESN